MGEDMTEKTPEERAAFEEKLKYWRKHGAPGVISDEACTPFRSMADGKMYDSKSEYRKSLKAQGYEEVGNEDMRPPKPKEPSKEEIVSDIKRVMGEL
jgi:hypothetical protein